MTASVWVGLWMALASAPAADGDGASLRTEASVQDGRRGWRPWGLRMEASTQFPILAGGRLELDLPGRFSIGSEVGVAPGLYLDLAETAAVQVGGLPATEVSLARQAAENAWGARAFLSWTPFGKGLYLAGGYSYTHLSGDLTGQEVLQAWGGQTTDPFDTRASVQTELHGVMGEVGVRWFVGRFSFRMSAGITATLDAPSRVQLQADPGPTALDPGLTAWSEDAEDELQAGFTEYGFVPSVGLGVGYTLPL